ncbi:MAG TPA: helix-turn-helix transcriptional regulator [Pyrinomonadaceae bacterium]|jgi:transcriptional regulator with XRE-family HTH domain
MGRVAAKKPRRIGKKLRQIRLMLDLSQDGIVERMGLKGKLKRTSVSNFERTRRIPSLLVLLHYARVAGICLEVLVDDKLDLPQDLSIAVPHDHSAKIENAHAK